MTPVPATKKWLDGTPLIHPYNMKLTNILFHQPGPEYDLTQPNTDLWDMPRRSYNKVKRNINKNYTILLNDSASSELLHPIG